MSRPPVSDNPHAVYMRKWRAANIERVREMERERVARYKAVDSEGFKARARERYERWLAKDGNSDKNLERTRNNRHRWRQARRGLTKSERHDYWLYRGGMCDFCAKPYPDPAIPNASRGTVVDHDHDHCDNKIGCIGCVRGQGHRVCNVIEGHIRLALQLGVITGIWGPLADYLSDPPMQRWLRERDAVSDAPAA